MRYYVSVDNLKTDGEELIYQAKNKIGTKYNELLLLLNNLKWEGKARNIFDENYKELINEVKNIEDIVIKLGAFIVTCSENYNKTEEQLIEKWKENILKYKDEDN